ncbi:MAG: hypothetical protein K6E13_01765 [Lachnospiraceae bacterium]|nr:hypothetical protein [Lachnospiraceae bacterium]
MADNKKVIKYQKPLHINIGVIIFAVILVYVLFYVYSYFTTEHTSVYEVVNGTIAINNSYKGLAIRDETVVTSDYTGYVNYYISDSVKSGSGDLVCSVDETGQIASQINSVDSTQIIMDDDNLTVLCNDMENFAVNYDADDFSSVYSFKNSLTDSINEIVNVKALNTVLEASGIDLSSFNRVYMPTDGVVTYYTDGYEDLTVDTFTASNYSPSTYEKNNLRNSGQVNAGDAIFRISTNENWNLMVPVDSDIIEYLKEKSAIDIKFDTDGVVCTCPFTIEEIDGTSFLNLNVRTGMIRYADDRYINIEIVLDEEKGLKIPNSSILKKDFYTVPIECFTEGGDSSDLGLIIETTDEEGNKENTFVTPTIYYETEDCYYIDGEDVSKGDVVVIADSSNTYTIGDTDQLKGVYNINKGYAVFKQIEIIYQNSEYTIIRSGTDYGVSLYDHIALDSSTIVENAIVN